MGVEEELMLLDPETLALAAAIEPIIADEQERGPAKRELMQCQAEVNTRPCRNAAELLDELVDLRAALRRDAAMRQVLVAGVGTLASTRLIILQTMPRTGLPPVFETYRDFESTLERLRRAGAIADATYLWWDIRLQPRLGTLEVRIMDVQPRVEDSAALAGLVQALVRHYGKLYDRGAGFAKADRLVVGENRWLAARYGIRAPLVTSSERSSARPRPPDVRRRLPPCRPR